MNVRLDQGKALELESPTLEGRTAFNEIDVDALAGDPVKTLIKYTGMARDDRVQVR